MMMTTLATLETKYPTAGRPRVSWPAEDVERMRKLAAEGVTASKMHQHFPERSFYSVQLKFYGLGLHRKDGEREPGDVPVGRKLEVGKHVKEMGVAEYCDWVLAGRPGFSDLAPQKIREWRRLWLGGRHDLHC